jgi:hypothetical protein
MTPTNTPLPHAEFLETYAPAVKAFSLAGQSGKLRLQHPRLDDEYVAQYYSELLSS